MRENAPTNLLGAERRRKDRDTKKAFFGGYGQDRKSYNTPEKTNISSVKGELALHQFP